MPPVPSQMPARDRRPRNLNALKATALPLIAELRELASTHIAPAAAPGPIGGTAVDARRVGRRDARVLGTLLFTDMVGSTQDAAAAGDRDWRLTLERHDDIVRRALRRHGGREIKHTGDGFVAVFGVPTRAVRCAATIIDRLGKVGIAVRAGLHAGEFELRDGDIAGIAVHIAARIAAHAAPREVLVSSVVADLVLGSGLSFEHRTTATLKGVPGMWRLCAAISAG